MLRTTVHINRKQASNFLLAIKLAEKIGLPLNLWVTISFAHIECSADEISDRFSVLRGQRFSPWINRPPTNSGLARSKPAFLWVIENAGCMNVHWLVHVPVERRCEFELKLAHWIETMFGPMGHETAIDVQQVYNPYGCRKYMLKGLDPHIARFYGIDPEDQGRVTGKRCGVSVSLGPTQARKHCTRTRWRPYDLMGAVANRR